ncbi:MAG: hypothetical protein CVU56_21070 [Deltaproteobacteria bacterium HGW-Deltaproteobacteria-14]|nr:MAG: hypothetical protein CVU56_21070 [Deltaproteobacteria bacterium HGW-Deltaproteobacteria-14]
MVGATSVVVKVLVRTATSSPPSTRSPSPSQGVILVAASAPATAPIPGRMNRIPPGPLTQSERLWIIAHGPVCATGACRPRPAGSMTPSTTTSCP